MLGLGFDPRWEESRVGVQAGQRRAAQQGGGPAGGGSQPLASLRWVLAPRQRSDQGWAATLVPVGPSVLVLSKIYFCV